MYQTIYFVKYYINEKKYFRRKAFSDEKKIFDLAFLYFSLIFLFSCATGSAVKAGSAQEFLFPGDISWQVVAPGFEEVSHKIRRMGVTWTCVRIDLQADGIFIMAEPSSPERFGQTFRVTDFARKNGLIVALNTTPFDIQKKTYAPVGITRIAGADISAPHDAYCALALWRAESGFLAKIVSQTEPCAEEYMFGGFFVILEQGQVLPFGHSRRSRSACGVSDGGRFLYLFAVTPDFSLTDQNGLDYEECALILRQLGCTDAMQFDGGHSVALAVNGKSVRSPLFARKVPAAFGFGLNQP